MPPSRTLNTQGRQRSCSECVKGKRRCDNERPQCARCSRQGLLCTYPHQSTTLPVSLTFEDGSTQLDLSTRAVNELPDPTVATSSFIFEDLQEATGLGDQLLDYDFSTALTSMSSLKDIVDESNDSDMLVLPHVSHPPVHNLGISWTNIDPLARLRIGYAIEQFKLAPKMMVDTNSTLWSHAKLYEECIPRPLQDAQAACALYCAKNDINSDFVIRHVTCRVEEIISTPLPVAPIDVLARSHTLILYQIMFIFSGNVHLHSRVGTLLSYMEEAGSYLLLLCSQEVDPVGTITLYPSTAARTAWRSFIVRESLRRTVLSLYQFVAVCYLLLGRRDSCAPNLATDNKVTLSAHLWRAKSAFDFAVAWNEKPHFLVHDLSFADVLENAEPDDIDEFTKTVLVGLQGIDDVKGWFYTRGGSF